MKRAHRLLAVIVLLIVGIAVFFLLWYSRPGTFEQRYNRVEVGMTEEKVQDIMGSEGDTTGKKYRITGDERQRVWVVTEKGTRLEIVVVFDDNSRVITKDIYKSPVIYERIFKDL